MKNPRIMALATLGSGSSDELRIAELLKPLQPRFIPVDRSQGRLASFLSILRSLSRERPDLAVLEGTGISGGAALWLAKKLFGTPYLVSSGDAVGPFISARQPLLGPIFAAYERLLCSGSAGFIGWTPYLAGRALTLGAPRAMTAPGWSPTTLDETKAAEARARVRARLGIPEQARVAGIAGSLAWTPRYGYAYGLELVRAMREVAAKGATRDVHVIIVGDGDGKARLEAEAGAALGNTIHLPGRVPRNEVADWLAAMDFGSLPQSVDGVGSFRYSTKLSEYLSAGLPVITGRIPLAYDLPGDWFWRLRGKNPWDPAYVSALSELLTTVGDAEIAAKRGEARKAARLFDKDSQVSRVRDFVLESLEEATRR